MSQSDEEPEEVISRLQKLQLEPVEVDFEKKSSNGVVSQAMISGMIDEQNKINAEIMEAMRMMREEMKTILDKQEEMKHEFNEKQEEMKQEFNKKLEKIQVEVSKSKFRTIQDDCFKPLIDERGLRLDGFHEFPVPLTVNRTMDKKQKYQYLLNNQGVSSNSPRSSISSTFSVIRSMKKEIEELNKKQDSQNEKINDISKSVDALKGSPDDIKVFFKTSVGRTITFEINPTSTVLEFKKKIKDKEGIPVHHQRLFFNDEHMEEEKTIQDYKVTNGSLLRLVIRLPGGPEFNSEFDW